VCTSNGTNTRLMKYGVTNYYTLEMCIPFLGIDKINVERINYIRITQNSTEQ